MWIWPLYLHVNQKSDDDDCDDDFFIFINENLCCDPSLVSQVSTRQFNDGSQDNYVYMEKLEKSSGPGCSKLTTSLVNERLKFQTLYLIQATIFC